MKQQTIPFILPFTPSSHSNLGWNGTRSTMAPTTSSRKGKGKGKNVVLPAAATSAPATAPPAKHKLRTAETTVDRSKKALEAREQAIKRNPEDVFVIDNEIHSSLPKTASYLSLGDASEVVALWSDGAETLPMLQNWYRYRAENFGLPRTKAKTAVVPIAAKKLINMTKADENGDFELPLEILNAGIPMDEERIQRNNDKRPYFGYLIGIYQLSQLAPHIFADAANGISSPDRLVGLSAEDWHRGLTFLKAFAKSQGGSNSSTGRNSKAVQGVAYLSAEDVATLPEERNDQASRYAAEIEVADCEDGDEDEDENEEEAGPSISSLNNGTAQLGEALEKAVEQAGAQLDKLQKGYPRPPLTKEVQIALCRELGKQKRTKQLWPDPALPLIPNDNLEDTADPELMLRTQDDIAQCCGAEVKGARDSEAEAFWQHQRRLNGYYAPPPDYEAACHALGIHPRYPFSINTNVVLPVPMKTSLTTRQREIGLDWNPGKYKAYSGLEPWTAVS